MGFEVGDKPQGVITPSRDVADTKKEDRDPGLGVVVDPALPPPLDKAVADRANVGAAQTGASEIAALRGGDRQANLGAAFERLAAAVDTSDFPGAKAAALEALSIARALKDQKSEARALMMAGYADYMSGDFDAGRLQVRDAKVIASMIGDGEREADCSNRLGLIAHDGGKLDEAIKNYRAALAKATDVGATEQIGIAHGNIGYWQRDTGATLEAVASYQKAADIAHSLGDRGREASWYSNIGIAYGDLGTARDREALAAYTTAAELAAANDAWTRTMALLGVGRIEQRLGHLDAAKIAFTDAAALAQGIQMLAFFAPAHLGMIALARGQREDALREFKQTIEVTTKFLDGSPTAQLPLWYRAIGRLGTGDAKGAMADLRTSFAGSTPAALVRDIRNQVALLPSGLAGVKEALAYLDERAA